MSAIIYEPLEVDETNLLATNLTETATAWAAGTSYSAGDEVYLDATKTVYISAIDGNVGNDPATSDETVWIIKGAMNKWSAFDNDKKNLATNAGTITYQIVLTKPLTGVSFFNFNADDITITTSRGINTTTYQADLNDLSFIGGSWYNWYFRSGDEGATFYEFPNVAYYGSGTILDITITSTGTAQIGQIIIGKGHVLGELRTNVELRNINPSVYKEDEFLNLQVTKRTQVTMYDVEIFNDSGNVKSTQAILKKLSDIPTVFSGSSTDELGLTVYGVLISSQPTIIHKDMHLIKMTFRELL